MKILMAEIIIEDGKKTKIIEKAVITEDAKLYKNSVIIEVISSIEIGTVNSKTK